MKKSITLLLCYLLTVDTTLHAMLYIPKEHNEIKLKTVQDVPRISLKKIGGCIEKLSTKKCDLIKKRLSNSFTFNIVLLPNDLKELIISKMLRGNTTLAEAYYKVPFLYAYKRYHEAKTAALERNLSPEETEELTIQLFALPTYQKAIIHDVLNPSFGIKIAYAGPIISKERLNMLNQPTAKFFFEDKNILMVEKSAEDLPLFNYGMQCLFIAMLCTGTSACAIWAIPLLTCHFFNYCPPLSSMLFFSSTATKISAFCWLIITSAIIRKRDNKAKIAF